MRSSRCRGYSYEHVRGQVFALRLFYLMHVLPRFAARRDAVALPSIDCSCGVGLGHPCPAESKGGASWGEGSALRWTRLSHARGLAHGAAGRRRPTIGRLFLWGRAWASLPRREQGERIVGRGERFALNSSHPCSGPCTRRGGTPSPYLREGCLLLWGRAGASLPRRCSADRLYPSGTHT